MTRARTNIAISAALMLLGSPLDEFVHAQGTVNFGNDGSIPVINSTTGLPATLSDGFRAALYWAPEGSYNFVQIGDAVDVGRPVPGVFAGGTRVTGLETPPGSVARFQVRISATQPGRFGLSEILEIRTGNSGSPPVPPPAVAANGLQPVVVGFLNNTHASNINSATFQDVPLTIEAGRLRSAAASIYSNSITAFADSTSYNGGTVVMTNDTVVYHPPAGFNGQDSFTYFVTDGHGGSAEAGVVVNVIPATSVAQKHLGALLFNGGIALVYADSPGQTFFIQTADTPLGPWTNSSPLLTIGTNGQCAYNDPLPATSLARFYRASFTAP